MILIILIIFINLIFLKKMRKKLKKSTIYKEKGGFNLMKKTLMKFFIMMENKHLIF